MTSPRLPATGLTRRAFGTALAASAAALALPRTARATPTPLIARPGRIQLAPAGYPETDIWGYGGAVPGETLRLPQGSRLTRRFVNELPQASSVHWHGIRIDNAMDGVAGLTQKAVEPGAEFLYDFTLPDAGSYWYHPHNRTFEQMARGLYGALIVEEASGAPEVDHDLALMLDDWRLEETAAIAGDFGNMHDRAHGGRIGNWITVNGRGDWGQPVARHARLRLRLVNAANARIFTLTPQGLAGQVVALDGMPLETPTPLAELTLGPSQRADLIVDVTAGEGEEAFLLSMERDGGYAVATFPVTGTVRGSALPAVTALPPNPVAPLGDLGTARRAALLMEGGAMGGMRSALLDGRELDARALAGEGMAWAFNGVAGMGADPLIEVARGETVHLAMRNDTAWPHAMHLHGHHFRQVTGEGRFGPLRDTLLVDRGEFVEIAFVADNPGDWLLHCHMLEHAAGGMMTWLRVA